MEDVSNLSDMLPIYYSRLFPFEDYFRWLCYGNVDLFKRREFSFTLGDDVYLRFQSFRDKKELEAEIKRLVPYKIDIGAVYNKCPRAKGHPFQPVERELVFDIDMTDYDDVRTCCGGAEVCKKCWKFMTLACKILDAALREDFGYNHILWIFSGRRGIHCWVCDRQARILTPQERSSVAEYLQLVTGGEYAKKKVVILGGKIHSSIGRAVDIITPEFVTMCIKDQNILEKEDKIEEFVQIMPNEEARKEVRSLFGNCSSGEQRWDEFVKYITEQRTGGSDKRNYRHLIDEIKLQYAYPRLDINVSKGMNHLLKSPFCVHPKTGKVCIPFTAKTVDKFDPDRVPTITTLMNEINKYDQERKNTEEKHSLKNQNIQDYKKTSLNKSLRLFHEFLWNLEETSKGKRNCPDGPDPSQEF